MTVIKCDKCGKEIEDADIVKYVTIEPATLHRFSDYVTYELCPKCANELSEWINTKKVKEKKSDKTEKIESAPNFYYPKKSITGIPECCKSCSNHPSNGGSGICYCTLPYYEQSTTGTTTNNTGGSNVYKEVK